ncbi:MFS transporter [Brachybacterium kimchii]|uniref:MFS transporter n=1 Tax=Brachybacterium kimchii TaxID=2942909 RepID=A0ABY4N5G2_9MICO|nr:MFS transporter [Brachybacterium kimchii]UQN29793.1 MFS transporter [Brachybacterium kimchii]
MSSSEPSSLPGAERTLGAAPQLGPEADAQPEARSDGDRPGGARRPGRRLLGRKPKQPRLEVDDVLVVKGSKVRTAIGGTVVGNVMEWFDFGVYGYMTLMLSELFFHTGSKSLDTILTLLGFAVSFLVRPFGGLVLGPLGDKIGRQKVLFFTMAMMAIATALIGVLPTHAQIGVWAAFLLYALKLVQGFSTGGEYAGATTYVSEYAPDKKRGFYASMLDVGSYFGFALGAGSVALTHLVTSSVWGPDAMLAWGWRVPFLIAIPLGAVAIWFRARIPETPAFEATEAEQEAEAEQSHEDASSVHARKGPIGIIRYHWRELLIAVAIVAATNTAGYALTSYMPTYLGTQFGYNEMTSAATTIPALLILCVMIPFAGKASDRFGRRAVYFTGSATAVLLMLPAFWLMHQSSFLEIQVAMVIVALPVAMFIGPSAAALPALFPTAARYGAMGIAYNISVSLFGGTTPVISQTLIKWTGNSYMPALWIMFFGLVAGIAVIFMRESAKRPLLGSFPSVETAEEARELVAHQDENPLLNTSEMPIVVDPEMEAEIEAAMDVPGAGLPSDADAAPEDEGRDGSGASGADRVGAGS